MCAYIADYVCIYVHSSLLPLLVLVPSARTLCLAVGLLRVKEGRIRQEESHVLFEL